MQQKAKQLRYLAWVLAACTGPLAQAAPWIEPGDEQLRHHVQVLADAGILQTPITTWPLMWGAVARDLERADQSGLDDALQWSLAYVRFAFAQASDSPRLALYAGGAAEPAAITDFGSDQREQNEARVEADWVGEHLAARLRATWAPDAADGKDYRLDGSYMAGLLGNWSVSAAAIDRWWGPGWQTSLLLSHNARPIPAVQLQRHFSDPFQTRWLSWIGPWTLSLFAGQLEAERAVPDAKLLGARLAVRPLSALELGFSRTAQWGGEGRPQNLDSLLDLLAGNDNTADDALPGDDKEPGNQLGAVDLRWHFSLLQTQSAFYMQYTGEDESGAFPSRGMDLAGLETAFATGRVFHRIAIEYIDSMAGAHGDNRPNTAYEHHLYQSGYRYRSRPLAATFDNDTRAIVLRADHYFADGNQFSWSAQRLHLNRDSTDRSGGWGGSVFGDEAVDTLRLQMAYSMVIKNLKFTPSVYTQKKTFLWNEQEINGTGLGLAVEYKFD